MILGYLGDYFKLKFLMIEHDGWFAIACHITGKFDIIFEMDYNVYLI